MWDFMMHFGDDHGDEPRQDDAAARTHFDVEVPIIGTSRGVTLQPLERGHQPPARTRAGMMFFALVFIGLFLFGVPSAHALTNGDVAIVYFTADGNDALSFVALTNVPANTKLYFSDLGWTNSNRRYSLTEGKVQWSHTSDLTAGTLVVITNLSGGTVTASLGTGLREGSINLSGTDSLLVSYSNSTEGIWHLFGTKWTTAWGSGTGTAFCQEPDELTNSTMFFTTSDNFRFDRTLTNGTKAELLAAITNTANWTVGGTGFPLTNLPFTVNDPVTSAPDVDVHGNNTLITAGDSTPTVTDHTDFNAVGVNQSNLVRTFTVTNSGSASLGIGNVTTSGTHAADFIVISQPSASLSAGGSTTFQVRFDPSAAGERNATLEFTNNVSGKTPYDFAVRGTGVLAGILRSPTTINVTTMVGSTPPNSSFGVTNEGLGRLDYDITTNVSWLSVSPVSAQLAEQQGQQETITFNVNGLYAGFSNGIVTITSSDASNSPHTVSINLTLTNIPDPTAQTAVSDGKEMVRLAWTKVTAHNVLVAYREGSAPGTPANGTGYSVGSALPDGGTVIYSGSGASLEHIVRTNASHYYAFHSINTNHYSPGVSANVFLGFYGDGEIVDQVAYTNGVNLHGVAGGVGWTNAWSDDNPGAFTIAQYSLPEQTNYPPTNANKIVVTPPSDVGRQAYRYFNGFTAGRVYAAYKLNIQYNGANKYSGMSFMQGGTEKMFFGEMYGGDQRLGIGATVSGSNLLTGVGNDYIVIARYDFGTDVGSVVAYKIGSMSVPATEPSTWHATHTDSSITLIDGIRLASGAGGGSGTPGATYFDEVRVATNWSELLRIVASPEIAVLGTNLSLISTGDTTPATADGTDFGSVFFAGSISLTNTFSITNSGDAMLTLSGITTSSAMGAEADFSVLSWPTSVAPGTKSNLVISFNPAVSGVRTALVSIVNNDSDENPYTFVLSGEGTGTFSTITFQGFEGATDDAWNYTMSPNGSEVYVDGDTNATGAYALTLRGSDNLNADPFIEFDNITISGYASVTLQVAFAVAGADSGDNLELDLSYDGGVTWSGPGSVTLVSGASNTNLGFTGIGSSTVASNPWMVSLPSTARQVRVRVRFNESVNANTFDRYFIDDVRLTGAGGSPAVSLGGAFYTTSETNGTLTVPVTISYAADATVRVALAGSALSGGVDYSANSTNIIFTSSGSTTSNLVFTLVNDTTAEGLEDLAVRLVNASGAVVSGPAIASVLIKDDDAFTVMSGNLTGGTNILTGTYTYDETAQRIIRRLQPDVLAIQEWKFTNASARAFVDSVLGTNYHFYIEPESDSSPIPNGVISRWPIIASNEWTDSFVGSRDHVHVTIDLPGARNLNVVSTHFKAGDTGSDITDRINQARALTNYIASAAFSSNDFLVIAGDLNLSNRLETSFQILTQLVTDAEQPVDQNGVPNTNLGLNRPYDHVLPNDLLNDEHLSLNIGGHTYTSGAVFVSAQFDDHLLPVLVEDSYTINRSHHAVIKLFNLSTAAIPPTVSTTIATATNLTTATAGGNVTADGGATVTNRGVVWTESPTTPTVPGAQTTNGTGTGSYSSTLTNLVAGQTYTYRAFAQSSAGTAYGATYSLTTPCFGGVVTGLYASVTNDQSFTATWTGINGASGYRLDVSTNVTFSGGLATIRTQDFEPTPASPTATYSASGGGILSGSSTSGDRPATSPFYSGGTQAYSVVNGTATITFDAIDSSALTDVALSMRLASFSIGSSGNGADGADIVTVSISPDNGANYYSTVRVLGNGNAYWSYADGVGVADTAYDGDTSPVDYQPASGGNRTTDGYSTIIISNLPAVSQLRIRVTMLNNSTAERWNIDDVQLTAVGTSYVPGYDNRVVSGTSQAVTGLTEGVTYYFRVFATNDFCATESSSTSSVTTLVIAPDMIVQGNGNSISDGDTSPTVTDHTDFGRVGLINSNLVRTFTITNTGNATLTMQNVAVGGTHPGDFTVTAQPSLSVVAGAATTFQVRFDPSVVGTRTATLFITNNVSGKNPFDFVIQGTGVQAGIVRSPTTIDVTSMVGSAPAVQNFGVTNGGLGQLIYTIATNVSWLTVSPTGATLAELAGQQHTVTFNVSTMGAGVSNATITIADGNASNTPQTIAVSITLTNIPDPTSVVLTNDGAELNRLSWTAPSGLDVMIVHNVTNAPSVPVLGTSYSVGNTFGGDGSRIIYKGSGSSLQHVVRPGVAQHYAFYAINNNHYSPGVVSNVVMASYPPNQSIEQFAYTNGVNLHGVSGGIGWTNAWSDSNPGAYTIDNLSFATQTNYPATAANKVKVTPPDNSERTAFRHFSAVTTGKVYFGYSLNFQYSGASKWSGLSFVNGTTEQIFFGETGAADQRLAVGGVTSGYTLNAGPGNDYLIMGYFDFENNEAKVIAYAIGSQAVPETEPGSWSATETGLSAITLIDGIRLASGGSGGGVTPGETYFDEIRIGRSWNSIIPSSGTPGIGVSPTNITVSVMRGSSPGNGNFGVTNIGAGVLNHVITTNVNWLAVSPVSGSLSAGAGQQHSIIYSTTTLSPGVSNATITITDAAASNSPRTVEIQLTITNIPAPAGLAVITDGPEMNRISWTGSDLSVLVLSRPVNSFTDPTQGSTYAIGDTIGSATVIYKGSAIGLEHIVAPGSTNFYQAYRINNDYYSSGVAVGSTTTLYRATEIVEQFSYTNGVGATSPSLAGGNGWTSAWTGVAGTWTILSNNHGEVSFPTAPLYPTNHANFIKLTDPGVSSTGRMHRYFPPVTNGSLYVAGFVAYQYESTNKFAGLSFMSGAVETGFIGKVSSPTHSFTLGIDSYGGSRQFAAYDFRGLENSTNNTYLVIGKYDFGTDQIFVQAYYRGISVPELEPAAWAATATLSGAGAALIDGVRIHGGADSGTIGNVYFDEIRVATNWSALINRDPPVVVTTIATSTGDVSAVSGGNVTSGGSTAVTNRGVVYGTSPIPTLTTNRIESGTGTGSYSSTLTNLIPGVTYYYRAFAQNNVGTAYGQEYTLVAQCFTSVVTGLYVNPTNSTDFTANWSARAGASSYQLDVSTVSNFSVTVSASAYTNTFEGVSKGSYSSGTVTIADITWWMDDALIGTSGSDRKNGSNSARIQNTGSIGMQTSTNMGLSSITLLYAKFGSDGDTSARVEYSTDQWTTWTTAGTFTATSTSLAEFEATNLTVSGSIAVRVIKTSGGGDRLNVDDITLYGYSASTYVPGYENRPVVGTSESVTGLISGITYYWRVRPVSDACTGGNSSTGSVMTVDDTGPYLFAFNVQNSTNTDAMIRSGFSVTGLVYDIGAGFSNGVSTPYFYILNNLGTIIATSNKFSTAPANGSIVTGSLAGSFGPVSLTDVSLGLYTSVVGAVDMSGNTSVSNFIMSIVDDDSSEPEQVTINSTNTGGGSLRFMQVSIGAANVTLGGGTTSNIFYPTTDGALAGVAATNPLLFWVGARDDSGLNRGTTNPSSNMNFTLDGIVVSNTANFDASRSTSFAASTNPRPTNVWAWSTAFTSDELTTLITNTVNGLGTNRISLSLFDADSDRLNDASSLINRQYGYLVVSDDDATPPVLSGMSVANSDSVGLLINEGFEDSTFPPVGWSDNSAVRSSTDPRSGSWHLTYNATNDSVVTPLLATPSYLSFWYKRSGGSDAWSMQVEIGTSASGPWTSLVAITSITETYQISSNNLTAYTNIYIRLRDSRPSGTQERRIDDIVVGDREITGAVTDGDILNGGYGIKLTAQDSESGLAVSNAAAPRYVIYNTNGIAVASNNFTTLFASGNTSAQSMSNSVAASSTNLITLGTNVAYYFAADVDNDRTGDSLTATGGPVSFVVVDDDTTEPVLSGFRLDGSQTNFDLSFGSIAITGLITDVSGAAYGGFTHFVVLDSTGAIVQSNILFAGVGSAATGTVSALGLNCGADYTVRVFAADADFDRSNDHLSVTQNVVVIHTSGVGTPADYPRATNLLVNGTAASLANTLTDGQIAAGSWSLAMSLTHPIGIFTNNSTPYFRVTNGLGIAIGATPWSNAFVNGTTTAFTNTTVPTVTYANVALGTYAVVWSASNQGSCVASIIDRDVIDGGTNVFTVIDDDATAPVLSGFTISGSSSTIDIAVALSGFSVTGLVQDTGSGVAFTSTPPYFLFYDVSGAVLASNTFNGFSEGDAMGSAEALTNWFSGLTLACGNIYTVRVFAADADNDRVSDRSSGSSNVLLITTTGAGGTPPDARDLLITNAPAASVYLTDALISTGGWSMAMTFTHASGDIVTNGPGQPSYLVNNPSNAHLYATSPLTWNSITKSGANYYATNASMPSAEFAAVMTGAYTIIWSAQSDGLCFGSASGSSSVSPGTNRFMVVDDDVDPPNLFNLNVGGGTGSGCGGSGGGCPDPTRTNLVAGDIAIFAINTLTRALTNNDAFAFVALVDIPTGTQIKFTDNGWKSSTASFRNNEGTITWRATNCVPAGTVIRWLATNTPVFNIGTLHAVAGSFAPNIQGEQIIAYQGSDSSPNFIYAVNDRLTGVWDVDAVDSHSSALPPGLFDGYTAVAVGEYDNIIIDTNTLSIAGSREDALFYIGDQENWIGSDTIPFDLLSYNFVFPGICASAGVITDADMLNGGWTITGLVQDLISGVAVSNEAGLRYVVMNTNGGQVVSNYFTTTFANGSQTLNAFSNGVSAGTYAEIQLGINTAQVHVADVDNDRPIDSAERSTNVPFQVVDDDTDPPQIGFFTINGQTTLTNPADLVSVVISGQVRDVTSGIGFVSQAPSITVLDAFGSIAYTGTFANAPVGEGDALNWEPIWTSPINLSGIADCGTYTVRVTIADADDDRLADRMVVTQQFLIAVTDGSGETPSATNFFVNGLPSDVATLTDGEIAAGGWSLAVSLVHPSGITIDPPYTPSFIVRDPFAVDVVSSEWSNIVTVGNTMYATNEPLPSIPYGNVHTGFYALLWSARSQGACYGEVLNSGAISGGTNTFLVIDDDKIGLGFTNLTYNSALANTLVTSFESAEGWSNTVSSTYATGFMASRDGVWNLDNVAANTTGNSLSSDRKIQFVTGSQLALPPKTDPGTLMFMARGVTGVDTNFVTVDYWPVGGTDWVNVGLTNEVAGTNYTLLSFPVDVVGAATVRVHAVTVNDSALYVDDLALTRYLAWTNTTAIELAWANPTNDISGVYQYRYDHAPANVPSNQTDGTATTTNNASLSASVEGVITGYVFMVDNDNDRANDRARGMNVPYVARIDLTPPVVITNLALSNDILDVNDDTSEMKVSWSPAESEAVAAGRRTDGEPLSPWQTYRVYYTDAETGPTTNDPYVGTSIDYPEMAFYTNDYIIMSNLIMGLEYRVAVAGVDQAGNIGPLSDVETKRLNVFNVTQAFVNAEGSVVVQWVGLPDRPYDVIYTDASGYSDAINGSWKLAQTVTGTNFVDIGGTNEGTSLVRLHPKMLPYRTMRFYRVAPVNGWISSSQRSGAASEQVIVALNSELKYYFTNGAHYGYNFIGKGMTPMVNTLEEFLGTNRLPSGASSASASQILLYEPNPQGQPNVTNYWLSTSAGPGWRRSIDNAIVNNAPLPATNLGFSIRVPSSTNLLLVGRVPWTNTPSFSVLTGAFNVISLNLPRPTTMGELGDMGLRTNLSRGININRIDEIRILQRGYGPYATPKARIYLNMSGVFTFWTGGSGSAEGYIIEADDAVIVQIKTNTAPFELNFEPQQFYSAPEVVITSATPAAPTVVALTPTSISGSGATLNGTVNPNYLASTAYYKYGLTTNYGLTTGTTNLPATNVAISVPMAISGLSPGTTYYIQLVASNSAGLSRYGTRSFATACANVSLVTTTLHNGSLQAGYSTNLTATGGASPYTYSVSGGSVPAGLTLSSGGLLSGTPTSAGDYTFYVTVYDTNNCASSASPLNLLITNNCSVTSSVINVAIATDGASTNSIAVSWVDGTNEDGYQVWRHTTNNSSFASMLTTTAANVTNIVDTSASPGQRYYYWVRGTNCAGMSAFGTSDQGYRKLETVSGMSASDNAYTDKVRISWSSVSGATAYLIRRDTDSSYAGSAQIDSTSSLFYDDTSASAGVTYYYWVIASNATSGSISDSGLPDDGTRSAVGLPVLSNPTVTSITSNGATLGATLDSHAGPLEGRGTVWGLSSAPTGNLLDDGGITNGVFSHARTGMPPGSLIYFRGWATNAVGQAYSPEDSFWTAPTNVPLNGVTNRNVNSFLAQWLTVPGATNYQLRVSLDDSFSTWVAGYSNRPVGNVSSHTVTGLTVGTLYYYQVRAENSGGLGGWSVLDSALTVEPEPMMQATSITFTNIGATNMTVSWTLGDGETRMVVARPSGAVNGLPVDGSTYSGSANFGSGSLIGSNNYVVYYAGTGTTVNVTGLQSNTVYFFRVFEYNGFSGAQNYMTNSATGNPQGQSTD